MRGKTATRILCLFTVTLYCFFSCLYVTRCKNFSHYGNPLVYLVAKTVNINLHSPVISGETGEKSSPDIFLSRPRVIFSKNAVKTKLQFTVVGWTQAHFLQLNLTPNKGESNAHRVFHAANIFSFLRTWRI